MAPFLATTNGNGSASRSLGSIRSAALAVKSA